MDNMDRRTFTEKSPANRNIILSAEKFDDFRKELQPAIRDSVVPALCSPAHTRLCVPPPAQTTWYRPAVEPCEERQTEHDMRGRPTCMSRWLVGHATLCCAALALKAAMRGGPAARRACRSGPGES